jgi:hypothetical protein
MPALLAILLILAGPLEPIGRLAHPAIKEASGIVASRRHPGIFWVHNDSGNPPALFAVRRDGTLVREYLVAAPNIDWEDIATDSEGHLYLGDIGNNGRILAMRVIYRLDEPDPSRPAEGPLKVSRTVYYRFGRKNRFDAEGLAVRGDTALVVAKTFDRREAIVYGVPIGRGASLLEPVAPAKLGVLPKFVEPATGASLAPDGRRLAVCSNDVVRVYDLDPDGPWTLLGEVRYQADDIEAVCWDGDDLILASEGRGIYRIAEGAWKRKE